MLGSVLGSKDEGYDVTLDLKRTARTPNKPLGLGA